MTLSSFALDKLTGGAGALLPWAALAQMAGKTVGGGGPPIAIPVSRDGRLSLVVEP